MLNGSCNMIKPLSGAVCHP